MAAYSQLVLPLQTRAALGRADFIVAPGNAQAVAFIDSWPGWPAPAAALHGPPASGKSHLAAVWAARTGAVIVAASQLRDAPPPESSAPLVVEDVEQAVWEPALFALLERGAPLLLTAQTPPPQWRAGLPDLVSRYRALLSFPLWAPDDALLAGLAGKLFADRQLIVPDTVIAHMIARLERSPGAIRDFVARADERALVEKRPVNLGLIKELLAEPPSLS
jgi:chromosomal replication initiation ATPase DnaA